MSTPESLAKHMKWLKQEDCTCDHAWAGMGVLYGVNMGKGWARTTTEPSCPHHANYVPRPATPQGEKEGESR